MPAPTSADEHGPQTATPALPVSPSVIATIDAAEFDLAFRGYRPDQVNVALEHIRAEVLELTVAYGQARREAETLRLRAQRQVEPPPPPPAPPAPPPAPISEHVAALLEEARRVVDEQFHDAADRAERIVAAAERLASELTDQARGQAEALVADARRSADDTLARAEAERARAAVVQDQLHQALHAASDAVAGIRESLPGVGGIPARPNGAGAGPEPAAVGGEAPRWAFGDEA